MKQFAVSLLFILILVITLVGEHATFSNYDNTPDRIYNADNNPRIFSIVVPLPMTQNLIYEGGAVYLGKTNNTLYFATVYHALKKDYKYHIMPQYSRFAGKKDDIAPLELLLHSDDLAIIFCPIQNNHKNIVASSATHIASSDLKPGQIVYIKNPLQDEGDDQNKTLFGVIEEYGDYSTNDNSIQEWSIKVRLQKYRSLSDLRGFSGNPVWHKEKLVGILWAANIYNQVFVIPASVIREEMAKAPISQSLKDEILR